MQDLGFWMPDCVSIKLGSIGHLLGIQDIGFRTCAMDWYNHVYSFIGFQLAEIYTDLSPHLPQCGTNLGLLSFQEYSLLRAALSQSKIIIIIIIIIIICTIACIWCIHADILSLTSSLGHWKFVVKCILNYLTTNFLYLSLRYQLYGEYPWMEAMVYIYIE